MSSEAEIQARALLAVGSLPGVRVSRNNVGAATDRTGRLVRYGCFGPGGSDVIGFRSLTVTPDMVGQKLAVFVAIEFKSETGKATPVQQRFIEVVQEAGGIAGIARSEFDALRLVASK